MVGSLHESTTSYATLSVAKSGVKDLSSTSSPEVRQAHHAEAFFAVGGAGWDGGGGCARAREGGEGGVGRGGAISAKARRTALRVRQM